jgi:hypothetical protein
MIKNPEIMKTIIKDNLYVLIYLAFITSMVIVSMMIG